MFELIRQLVNLYGATGREAGVADAVEALVKDHVDSIRRDALGNLICEKRGTDPDGKRICQLIMAGMSEREIAAAMGRRQSTVNYQKRKVLAALREALEDLYL